MSKRYYLCVIAAALILALLTPLAAQHISAALDLANVFTNIGNQFTAGLQLGPVLNAGLSSINTANGVVVYCSDCTQTNPCAGSGTGALAQRINGAWNCAGASSGITGSGTANTFPLWSSTSVLGNSSLTTVTSPNGINYSLGSGLSWQIDASHLTFNSGIGGSGNIVLANTYSPGSGNNAGGVLVQGAPTSGSACAGNVVLQSGATSSNSAQITAAGGCSNGLGPIGSNITLTAGGTASNNPGGSIILQPGGGVTNNGVVQVSKGTTALLPTCNSGQEGSYMPITDASVNTWGSTFSGSGTNHILAYCDGTHWTVAGQ